jgi:archaellum biogenesis ATPase FlaH
MIELNKDGRFTYINEVTGEKWSEWKKYSELTEKEKQQANLGIPSNKYIILDIDLKNKTEQEIKDEFNKIDKKLIFDGYPYFYADRTPHGFHIFLPFNNLEELDETLQKEIRKIFIKEYGGDEAKISMQGVISLPNKPHFKTGEIYPCLKHTEGFNILTSYTIETAKKLIEEKTKRINQAITEDVDFKDYFEKDKFFNFIATHKIPDGTNRDMVIFPNLAVACVKSGKSKQQIDEIMKPLISKNFPGKNYAEFEGWLKKAISGDVNTYNPIQLNKWAKTFYNRSFYDLTPLIIEILDDEEKNITRKKFLTHQEIKDMKEVNLEWIIKDWLPFGDICFLAGKAAAFKTTIAVHIAFCVANGLPIFQNYETKKNKVLYLNEENNNIIFKQFIDRIAKGLDIDVSENIYFSLLENFRLDKIDSLEELIHFINTNEIKLLICDSFRRFIGFDENNATEMNSLFTNLKRLRKRCKGLTIVILHHLKKDNSQIKLDVRDMLRGSSDIVNSCDNVIGVSRRHGSNSVIVSHIKNRAGAELLDKVIRIEGGNEKAYLYETKDREAEFKALSASEKASNILVKFLEDKKITTFQRKDMASWDIKLPYDAITKALKILEKEGLIISSGSTKNRIFMFNSLTEFEKEDVDEIIETENEEIQELDKKQKIKKKEKSNKENVEKVENDEKLF